MKVNIFKKVKNKLKLTKATIQGIKRSYLWVGLDMAVRDKEITADEAMEIWNGRINSVEDLETFRRNREQDPTEQIILSNEDENSKLR